MNRPPHAVAITIANQKGGVGKTTTAVHLAAALGQGGYRCLVIDLDPAAGATRHLGVAENQFAGTLELLCGTDALTELVLTEHLPTGVHLVASRPQLSELDARLSRFTDRTRLLEQPLAQARREYDFVFLDTAPIAGATTTIAAYSATEWILLSAFPHPLSLGGLTEAFRDIADVRQHRNPRLEVLGVVFTNVDARATRLRAEMESAITTALPGRLFETHISQAVIIPEVSGRGQTLFQLRGYPRLPAAQQFLRLAAELEHRIRHRDEFLAGRLPPLARARVSTPHSVAVAAEG
ncbi:MAG: ParA family protein [Phycisphaerales bacterium]|nr:ParA family protein [Phycisphaerales bacterium]